MMILVVFSDLFPVMILVVFSDLFPVMISVDFFRFISSDDFSGI